MLLFANENVFAVACTVFKPCRMNSVLGQIDLLALILACLPMSKHKLGLQLVSKTWKEALERPAAHFPKTDDSQLPFAGHGMSKGVTQVLSQCESEACFDNQNRNCDGWLGPGLQRLTLRVEEDTLPLHLFESLPIMPRLHYLNLDAEDAENFHQYDFSQKFPSLKTLVWTTGVSVAPSYMERLTELTRFEFHIREHEGSWDNPDTARGKVGALPKDCKVTLSILDMPLPLPAGLINQVTRMVFIMNMYEDCWPQQTWEAGKPVIDFGNPIWPAFSQATSLKAFRLTCGQTIVVRNLGVLPRSCKRLEFHCLELQPPLANIAENGFRFGEVDQCSPPFKTWVLTRD